jgi:alanine racemase
LTPPFKVDIEKAIENDVTISVEDYELLVEIDKIAYAKKKIAKIELIVNTGMNRFGFAPKRLVEMLPKIKRLSHISVRGVFSHFYQAENFIARHKQSKIFADTEKYVKDFFPLAISHISASGGFIKGEYFDAVRIGLLLYGYYPFKVNQKKFSVNPIMSVYSPIVKSGTLTTGEQLLYGKYKVKEDTEYSLIRYGYADGLPRKAVKGQFNNRCMDITAVECATDDYFVVMDNAETLAKAYHTISYEILTKVCLRAEKIYLR